MSANVSANLSANSAANPAAKTSKVHFCSFPRSVPPSQCRKTPSSDPTPLPILETSQTVLPLYACQLERNARNPECIAAPRRHVPAAPSPPNSARTAVPQMLVSLRTRPRYYTGPATKILRCSQRTASERHQRATTPEAIGPTTTPFRSTNPSMSASPRNARCDRTGGLY